MASVLPETNVDKSVLERLAAEETLMQELGSRLTIPKIHGTHPFEIEAKDHLIHPAYTGFWSVDETGPKNFFGLSVFDVAERLENMELFEETRGTFQGFTIDDYGIASVVGKWINSGEARVPGMFIKTYLNPFAHLDEAIPTEYEFVVDPKTSILLGNYRAKVPIILKSDIHSGLAVMEHMMDFRNSQLVERDFKEMYNRALERLVRYNANFRAETPQSQLEIGKDGIESGLTRIGQVPKEEVARLQTETRPPSSTPGVGVSHPDRQLTDNIIIKSQD